MQQDARGHEARGRRRESRGERSGMEGGEGEAGGRTGMQSLRLLASFFAVTGRRAPRCNTNWSARSLEGATQAGRVVETTVALEPRKICKVWESTQVQDARPSKSSVFLNTASHAIRGGLTPGCWTKYFATGATKVTVIRFPSSEKMAARKATGRTVSGFAGDVLVWQTFL